MHGIFVAYQFYVQNIILVTLPIFHDLPILCAALAMFACKGRQFDGTLRTCLYCNQFIGPVLEAWCVFATSDISGKRTH